MKRSLSTCISIPFSSPCLPHTCHQLLEPGNKVGIIEGTAVLEFIGKVNAQLLRRGDYFAPENASMEETVGKLLYVGQGVNTCRQIAVSYFYLIESVYKKVS